MSEQRNYRSDHHTVKEIEMPENDMEDLRRFVEARDSAETDATIAAMQAEIRRLRAALEQITHVSRSSFTEYRQDCERMIAIARKALAGAAVETTPRFAEKR